MRLARLYANLVDVVRKEASELGNSSVRRQLPSLSVLLQDAGQFRFREDAMFRGRKEGHDRRLC